MFILSSISLEVLSISKLFNRLSVMVALKWFFINLRTLNTLSLDAEETGDVYASLHKELAEGMTDFSQIYISSNR